jgi:hypothetical protein
MLLLGLKWSKVDRRMRCRTSRMRDNGDKCTKILQRQPFLFLLFCECPTESIHTFYITLNKDNAWCKPLSQCSLLM